MCIRDRTTPVAIYYSNGNKYYVGSNGKTLNFEDVFVFSTYVWFVDKNSKSDFDSKITRENCDKIEGTL